MKRLDDYVSRSGGVLDAIAPTLAAATRRDFKDARDAIESLERSLREAVELLQEAKCCCDFEQYGTDADWCRRVDYFLVRIKDGTKP